MKVGILGTGVYALALTEMFKENKCEIIMWSKFEEEVINLSQKYEDIRFTDNLKNLKEVDLLVIAVPSVFVKATLEDFKDYYDGSPVLIASKGILEGGYFMSDLVKEILATSLVAVISGPTFAVDMKSKVPLGLTLATTSEKVEKLIREALENKFLKLEGSSDVYGVQFCGSVKNVIAISTGIIEGLGYPESTRYKYLTEIIQDLAKNINKVGGEKKTILSYAGFGDLLLTSTCTKSRNYSFGVMVGQKGDKDNYLRSNTVEGYHTLKTIYELFKEKEIKMAAIDSLYDVIYGKESLEVIVRHLSN